MTPSPQIIKMRCLLWIAIGSTIQRTRNAHVSILTDQIASGDQWNSADQWTSVLVVDVQDPSAHRSEAISQSEDIVDPVQRDTESLGRSKQRYFKIGHQVPPHTSPGSVVITPGGNGAGLSADPLVPGKIPTPGDSGPICGADGGAGGGNDCHG